MNRLISCVVPAALVLVAFGSVPLHAAPIIIDHTRTDITKISKQAILNAKSKLHIAYGHTSHGSQITDGMTGLIEFANRRGKGLNLPKDIFAWNNGGADGALDLRDGFAGGDLGNPNRTAWAERTREYLNNPTNRMVNVVMWSWCGQVDGSPADINTYLGLMNRLEADYPKVKFVYMTGHLNGTGLSGNVHQRNEQIRLFCRKNGKILFDFADIETYNPDGVCFADKNPTDGCDYGRSKNWAEQWQNSHKKGVDWYECGAAHTQPLNANMKAYAAWALWTDIAASMQKRGGKKAR